MSERIGSCNDFALLPRIPQATPTNLSTEAGNPSAIQIKAIQADRHQVDQTAPGKEERVRAQPIPRVGRYGKQGEGLRRIIKYRERF